MKLTENNDGLFSNDSFFFVTKTSIFINPFSTNVRLYTPWKNQKTFDFLIFLGVIEVEHWVNILKSGVSEYSGNLKLKTKDPRD